MQYKFTSKELGKSEIEIHKSFWTGRTLVFVDGNEVSKQKKVGYYELKSDKGDIKRMIIKGAGFDSVPKVFIEDKEVVLARKLLWYEYLIAVSPVVLVIAGGVIGGLFGALAAVYNFRIIRSSMSLVLKALSIMVTTILAGILYILFTDVFLRLFS